jgi:hypothetical protein
MSDEKKDDANTEVKEVFVDGVEHLWEYYSEGEFVDYDTYIKSAHKSYFEA